MVPIEAGEVEVVAGEAEQDQIPTPTQIPIPTQIPTPMPIPTPIPTTPVTDTRVLDMLLQKAATINSAKSITDGEKMDPIVPHHGSAP